LVSVLVSSQLPPPGSGTIATLDSKSLASSGVMKVFEGFQLKVSAALQKSSK
jgi:hypothetical protein